jgi:hypothetical protein
MLRGFRYLVYGYNKPNAACRLANILLRLFHAAILKFDKGILPFVSRPFLDRNYLR